MWSPTHVQVTVQKARGLIGKGKNGTNDVFVTIGLGKEKFQTSIKEKASSMVEWHEKCELLIPKQGNRAEIILTALHHNLLGVDEFLGRISIPLVDMDVYERPKNKWYKLGDKPGKDKNKDRGELEVKIAFIVKAGSLSDLTKKEKHKSSLGQLSQAAQSFGGSLISISSLDKRKGLKKFATKIGNKLGKGSSHKKSDDFTPDSYKAEISKQRIGEADPGVISEGESDDDFTLDELSHKSSGCSINISVARSVENVSHPQHEFTPPPAKPPRSVTTSFTSETLQPSNGRFNANDDKDDPPSSPLERIIIGREMNRASSPITNLSPQVLGQYSGKSREELIQLIMDLQHKLTRELKRQRDLEDYLDQLLLRVMETSPRILQNPYKKNIFS
uniref:Rab11 family-interacting protein 1 n=1 Tax=Lygus hesperus TaxID=30085 RepID=A0A0A9W3S2_LYGHE